MENNDQKFFTKPVIIEIRFNESIFHDSLIQIFLLVCIEIAPTGQTASQNWQPIQSLRFRMNGRPSCAVRPSGYSKSRQLTGHIVMHKPHETQTFVSKNGISRCDGLTCWAISPVCVLTA